MRNRATVIKNTATAKTWSVTVLCENTLLIREEKWLDQFEEGCSNSYNHSLKSKHTQNIEH